MLRFDNVIYEQDDFRMEADLTIQPGARVAIIGPSGSGKSTFLSLIAGFIRPDRGRILWHDSDLSALPPGSRPLSILFQDQNLFPHLTVDQNVGLGLRPDLRLSPDERKSVEQALERTGLGGLGARYPAALSGGQQSRVSLARALLRARPLLLLDEPFSALGPALKSEMLDLVRTIAGETGATVLLVSHDPQDARHFAPETVLVADGLVHPPRQTGDLLDNPPPALAAYLGK